jgi:hypothetical protein
VHVIKLPNLISKMAILKIRFVVDSEIVSEFQTVEEIDIWLSADTPHECSL